MPKIIENPESRLIAEARKQIEENGQLAGYKEQLAAEKALDFVLGAAK